MNRGTLQNMKFLKQHIGFLPILGLLLTLMSHPLSAAVLETKTDSASVQQQLPHLTGPQDTFLDLISLAGDKCTSRDFPFRKKLKLQCGSNDAYFTAENPFVIFNGTPYSLTSPIKYTQGRYWIPVQHGLPLLDSLLQQKHSWHADSLKLSAVANQDILKFAVSKKKTGTLIELETSRKILVEKFFQRPYFMVRLAGTKLDTAKFRSAYKEGLVVESSAIQDANSAQLTFKVRNTTDEQVEMIQKNDGKKIQFVLRKKGASKAEKVAKQEKAKAEKNKKPEKTVKTVIIDPGHGGKDPGALGKSSHEKDIALAVGLKLKKELEGKGFSVKMTRSTDKFLGLKERPELATKWEGDLFVSLHCNAIDGNPLRKKRVKGFKSYILREAKSEADKTLARRENKAIEMSAGTQSKKEISPVEWILLEHQLNLYTKESERFTGHIVEKMGGSKIAKQGSGAGQAGFYVLVGAFMPAVLYEMGFITNPTEEKYMASKKGQNEIAAKLAKSIAEYRDDVESRH